MKRGEDRKKRSNTPLVERSEVEEIVQRGDIPQFSELPGAPRRRHIAPTLVVLVNYKCFVNS